jgi:flagellar basal-body rod protein FlgC
MAMNDVFRISSSALTAQSLRLNTTASNLANAESAAGPDGKVYRAKQVVFQTDPLTGNGGAVRPESAGVSVARVVEDNAAPKKTYDPKHPLADADGYVSMPNVNVVDEMVNMISASRSYQTNVEVMNTAKTLMLKALTLGT